MYLKPTSRLSTTWQPKCAGDARHQPVVTSVVITIGDAGHQAALGQLGQLEMRQQGGEAVAGDENGPMSAGCF